MQNFNQNSQFFATSSDINSRTPYQGRNRCFGEFRCQGCMKVWKSAKSRANESQTCTNCHRQVYPQKQKSFNSLYENLRREKYLKMAIIDAELAAQKQRQQLVEAQQHQYCRIAMIEAELINQQQYKS